MTYTMMKTKSKNIQNAWIGSLHFRLKSAMR